MYQKIRTEGCRERRGRIGGEREMRGKKLNKEKLDKIQKNRWIYGKNNTTGRKESLIPTIL